MQQIQSGNIAMKPKWFFIFGSVLTGIGMVSSLIVTTFLLNLALFLSRQHGPGGEWRLQLILSNFPWWLPIVTVISIATGVWALKQYEFSYKKNFLFVILGFLMAIIISAVILDQTGLNTIWFSRGPMRQWYEQHNSSLSQPQRGRGFGRWQ